MQNDNEKSGPTEKKDQREDKAAQFIQPLLETGITLFHDQYKNGYIAWKETSRQKIIRLDSREFKRWFSHKIFKETRKALSKDLLEKCVNILQGKAIYEEPEIELHLRFADHDGAWWYDLGDGLSVRVDDDGWTMVQNTPILFRSFKHQKTQVLPEMPERSLNDLLFEYAPAPSHPQIRMLLLVWTVVSLIPGFPHPILVAVGPQGARKTTLNKILKQIIDPSQIETFAPQTDMRELIQIASHHFLIPLDNLSHINEDFSDILCRLVSGSGFSKRELYTDDSDIVYNFRRLVTINGINNVVEKPDLLERSLIIALERPDQYKEEKVLFAEFNAALPKILGALFDVLARTKALAKKELQLEGIGQYRMADFVRWGSAAAEALGYAPEVFLEAWQNNSVRQHEEAIDSSPFAQTVIALMENSDWDGTPTELLYELRTKADSIQIDHKRKPFPQGANTVWKALQVIKMTLESVGIKMETTRDKQRHIKIYRPGRNTDDAVVTVDDIPKDAENIQENTKVDISDGNDGIFTFE